MAHTVRGRNDRRRGYRAREARMHGARRRPRAAGAIRAGHDLCLFHDEDGTAWFKHREIRAHVTVTARRRAAGDAA